jgi:hypothetical protein
MKFEEDTLRNKVAEKKFKRGNSDNFCARVVNLTYDVVDDQKLIFEV